MKIPDRWLKATQTEIASDMLNQLDELRKEFVLLHHFNVMEDKVRDGHYKDRIEEQGEEAWQSLREFIQEFGGVVDLTVIPR